MDPNELVRLMNNALHSGDFATVRFYARELLGWIDRGGFTPTEPLDHKFWHYICKRNTPRLWAYMLQLIDDTIPA